MKKILFILTVLMTTLIVASCSCEHENTTQATCAEPARCENCGEDVGEPTNNHKWDEATCYKPKTCRICGKTEGEIIAEHSWLPADCKTPIRCEICGDVKGEPLGHSWIDATYEAPKTCTICLATDGEPKEKPDLDTMDGLEEYLSTNYSEVETCAGKYTFSFECYENDFSYFGYDYQIKVLPENDYLFSNIAPYSTKYTSAQKKQAKSELKDFMYKMANDIMPITNKRIKMYYDASYDIYEHIKGGYRYNAYCTCANYDFSIETAITADENTYEKTPKTSFSWYPKNDKERW